MQLENWKVSFAMSDRIAAERDKWRFIARDLWIALCTTDMAGETAEDNLLIELAAEAYESAVRDE